MTKARIQPVLGKAGTRNVVIDLLILLATRLLITANSGGGKSWALRRLIEQCFAHIQIIIIDPEGEFATLREKFPFVLVGPGGETPANARSADLLAHKLLETRASAVCDLYEMDDADRHRWVRLFLEALINAPKKFWHPLLLIVDEAHMFCPEKGQGESEATQAMIAFTTRGRKRGFCAVYATQALASLHKLATRQLTNRLIGPMFEDLDTESAMNLLKVPRKERLEFSQALQMADPGHFIAYGRALSCTRLEFVVGDVETTHPEIGGDTASEPPPTPEKVRALLPQFANLPQQAEQKVRTEAELRAENADLRRHLNTRPTVTIPDVRVEQVQIPIFKDGEVDRLQAVVVGLSQVSGQLETFGAQLQASIKEVSAALQAAAAVQQAPVPNSRISPTPAPRRAPSPAAAQKSLPRQADSSVENISISGPEQSILDAIAWFEGLGIQDPQQSAVAFLAGYSSKSKAYSNPRGRLKTKALVEYLAGDRIGLTPGGRAVARASEMPLTREELQHRVMSILGGPEQRVLNPLLKVYPNSLSKTELAEQAGYPRMDKAFTNPLGRLRSLEIIEYLADPAHEGPERNRVKALPVLFLE